MEISGGKMNVDWPCCLIPDTYSFGVAVVVKDGLDMAFAVTETRWMQLLARIWLEEGFGPSARFKTDVNLCIFQFS
jgi:hypothetical protein